MEHLIREINAAHRRATDAMRTALLAAKECGELLIEVKVNLKHGKFGKWIRDNCEFGERTARDYMTIARNWESLSKRQRVADLSLRQAIALIKVSMVDDGAPVVEHMKCPACEHPLVQTSGNFATCVNCWQCRLIPIERKSGKRREKPPEEVAGDIRNQATALIYRIRAHQAANLPIADRQQFAEWIAELAAIGGLSVAFPDDGINVQSVAYDMARFETSAGIRVRVYQGDWPVKPPRRRHHQTHLRDMPDWLEMPTKKEPAK